MTIVHKKCLSCASDFEMQDFVFVCLFPSAFHQNGFLLSHALPGVHSKDEHPETKHDGKDRLATEQGKALDTSCTMKEREKQINKIWVT